MQCYNCQCFGHSAETCRLKPKCLICGESHSHKGCPTESQENPHVQNCNGPHVASYKGCPEYTKQAFRQHVVNNQKSYASVVSQNTLSQPKPNQTFTFTAEQLTEFAANVVIQIAQPQVCYPNPKQDTLDLKSSMCRKVSQAAKNILKFDITGKDLFETIGPLSTPPPLNSSHSRVPKYICSKLLHDSTGLPYVKDRPLSCATKSLDRQTSTNGHVPSGHVLQSWRTGE